MPRLAFRSSLARPIQLGGGDRRLIGAAFFGGAYLGFIGMVSYGIMAGLAIGCSMIAVFYWLALRAGKNDPHFFDVWMRHSRYRRFYPARGRFTAAPRNYRE